MNDKFITQRITSMSHADLMAWNKLINARIAGELEDAPPPLQPTDTAKFLAELGDGTREYEGLQTGMTEIDHLIGGLHKFVLLAARAGTGKSTLAVQLALGVMAKENVPVIYYSYEMEARDILTMVTQQAVPHQLTRKEIVLHGNAPRSEAAKQAMDSAAALLPDLTRNFYVKDTSAEPPNLGRLEEDIKSFATPPLVIIDSLQDLIDPTQQATTAEAVLAQELVQIQQATGATILAISQKAKGNNLDDPYSAVLGSVSLIHKPTAVLELIGVYDLIRKVKDADTARTFLKLADNANVPRPVVARVIKGRHNGSGHVSLMHDGPHGVFEVGHVHDYEANTETSLYDLNAFPN